MSNICACFEPGELNAEPVSDSLRLRCSACRSCFGVHRLVCSNLLCLECLSLTNTLRGMFRNPEDSDETRFMTFLLGERLKLSERCDTIGLLKTFIKLGEQFGDRMPNQQTVNKQTQAK